MSAPSSSSVDTYYVPAQSRWPIVATIGLFLTLVGAGSIMNANSAGESAGMSWLVFLSGALIMAYMLFGWFGHVIKESQSGMYSEQMDRSFRWGMSWFIFSEVMFFAAFFGALFYVRVFAVPWLGGEGAGEMTHELLWPNFEANWPLMSNPDQGLFQGPAAIIDPWHLPLINTLLLLASSVTVTIAHHALKNGDRNKLTMFLAATIGLGLIFLFFQGEEYVEAYNKLDLTLESGIYGTTFFLLTGFHGAHVTLGTLMLIIMFFRVRKGHFTKDNHFAFEATSWYWHFVDVVWIGLFIFVYII